MTVMKRSKIYVFVCSDKSCGQVEFGGQVASFFNVKQKDGTIKKVRNIRRCSSCGSPMIKRNLSGGKKK
jgi:hypothetical protein